MQYMQLRAVTRGKFRQVVGPGGGPVEAALHLCQVVSPPAAKNGKTYMTLDISECLGDVDLVKRVDAWIDKHASPRFSPLLPGHARLVVKLPPGVRFENVTGDPAAPWPILANAVIDVVIRPGAFGEFGYCWLLQRVKPSSS